MMNQRTKIRIPFESETGKTYYRREKKIRATREQGETETIESPSNQSYVKQEQRSRGRRVEDQY